jgi:hypothetical protein
MAQKLVTTTYRGIFQDGVGVGTRSPKQARATLEELQKNLAKKMVIVLEAFRPKKNGKFRLPILGKLWSN